MRFQKLSTCSLVAAELPHLQLQKLTQFKEEHEMKDFNENMYMLLLMYMLLSKAI